MGLAATARREQRTATETMEPTGLGSVARLSAAQVAAFIRDGYLVQRNVLDQSMVAVARKLHEQHVQATGLSTFDRALCADPRLLDMLPRRCWHVAEQLVGPGTLVRPSSEPAAVDGPKLSGGGVAGGQHLRAIVSRSHAEPVDPKWQRRPQHGCHVDAHPFSLGIVTYLHDVDPGAGGFTVWPGTHRRAFWCFPWHYSSRLQSHAALAGDGGNEGVVKELVQEVLRDTVPVALHLARGDVIYFHHRLLHAGGHNLTDTPRVAVFYDYVKVPAIFRARSNLAEPPSENGDGPPPENMWEDWSDQTQRIAAQTAPRTDSSPRL